MSNIIEQHLATDVSVVGGKAAALTRLAAAGFTPPAYFVVRAECFTAGPEGPVAAEGFARELQAALSKLGAGPFAVRSSAQSEDSASHSHAGQFDTVLNVAETDVPAAIAQVWASGFGDRVTAYREKTTGDEAQPPAIIVQRMLDVSAAGVVFSADPVTGQRGHAVISAIAGLGEALVSGEADGEDWILDPHDQIVSGPDKAQVLSTAQAREVATLARAIEEAFGAPQDIEWAIDADGLHVLQARPITTALRPVPNPDNALTIFDNSNIVESYPGMVSPLTYSFAVHVYDRVYRAFVSLLGLSPSVIAANSAVFGNMLGRVDGRVYYNLVNWYRALALLPGFSLNRAYMETMMGVSEPLPREITETIGPPPATGLRKLVEYARVARVGCGLVWQALRLPRTRARFYERLNAALNSGFDVSTASATQLAAEYRKIESSLLDRWDAPLVNDFLCMIAFGASRNLLHKWLGEDGLRLHNDVMIGQGDIISAEPAQRIARMGQMVRSAGVQDAVAGGGVAALQDHPEILAEFQDYLSKFGDRCTEELKLESIPLSQDPTPLIYAIAASAGREATASREASEPDWEQLFDGHILRRYVAKWLVGWAKARVRDRENLRFERTRIFGHARRVFLALGDDFVARGLIDEPRDVFFLTTDEVLGAVEGFGLSPGLSALVALRKSEDTVAAGRPDPPERIEVRGPAIAPVWSQQVTSAEEGQTRTGTGCSAGRIRATARVIRDPRTEKLAPGEILVARHTDPGWIAVFSNAAAIVVERGSLLSHSAIVARELGIPCVVGLKGATTWITDGETVDIDGATGRVERVNG